MGIVDGVADVGEPAEKLAQVERALAAVGLLRRVGVEAVDRDLQAVAADEPHGVIGPAVGVRAQSIDWHDARMLETAGDLGFEQEPLTAGRVVGVIVQDLLERDLAVQLAVQCDEDGAEAAAGVRPQDAEAMSIGGGRSDGIAAGAVAVKVVLGRAMRRGEAFQGRLEFRASGARGFRE